MKIINDTLPVVIGVDHGYGNIKTANTCFPTGVKVWDTEPTFKNDLLIYEGKYYTIGGEHREYTADKIGDNDFYILTLSAIARELNIEGKNTAQVFLGAGLPLTWVGEQKESFKAYLLKNETADFSFRGKQYHVEFAGAEIYPQGFSAVADKLRKFKQTNMLCDIGNGTMNILVINNGRPVQGKCYTEKYGTYQCTLEAKEILLRKLGKQVDESIIETVLRKGKADVAESVQTVISDLCCNSLPEIRWCQYWHHLISAALGKRQGKVFGLLSPRVQRCVPQFCKSKPPLHPAIGTEIGPFLGLYGGRKEKQDKAVASQATLRRPLLPRTPARRQAIRRPTARSAGGS